MAGFTTLAILGTALATSAVATGFQVSQAQGARRQARRLAGEQRTRQEELAKKFRTARATQESEAKERSVRAQARRRQKALTGRGTGRSETILTGPGGVTEQAVGTRKTLLGV